MEIELRFSALGMVHHAQGPCLFRLGEKLCIDLLSLHPGDAKAATFFKQARERGGVPCLPNQLVHEFGAALDLSGGFLDGQHKILHSLNTAKKGLRAF